MSVREWMRENEMDEASYDVVTYKDDVYVIPIIPKCVVWEACGSKGVGPVKCQLSRGHKGEHVAEYWHLGGLYCIDGWYNSLKPRLK